jgi:hypothetical protein
VPNLLARSGLGVVRMLILAIRESPGEIAADAGLDRLARETVQRLVARYPDRYLVVASTLADPGARLVSRIALDCAGAGLFLLCPRPLPEILSEQKDQTARLDLVGLVVRAERRIPLAGGGGLERWLAERVEICLSFEGGESTDSEPTPAPTKRVVLDPARGRIRWGFDY